MAMLAEPRRKQKISVNPQGSNWSNDESKFGQKMLERMGWNKGQGLGAGGTGRVDHVKISFKDDQRGVGCTKNHADTWISHQDDFNSLLESLNEGHGDGGDNSNTEKVACLEEKSQTSKKRVHYSKSTRGKDLSSKSNADLDCIFGKRKSKKTGSGESTPTVQLECPETEDTKADHSHGFNTIKSTSTVQEYFAKKMAALKGQNVASTDSNTETLENTFEDESCMNNNSNEKKKKKKKSKRKEVEEVNDEDSKGDNSVMENADVESRTNVESDVVEVPEKRTKKSKKSKRKDIPETVEENEPSCKNVKSKKKKKLKEVNESKELQVDNHENIEEEVTKKKSKKRKRKECAEEDNSPEVEEENVVDKKRRKKDKKTRLDDATSAPSSQEKGATLTSNPKILRTTLTHYLRKEKRQKSKLHPLVKSVCESFKGANVASIVGYDKSSMSQAEMLYKISVKHGYALRHMKLK